VLREKTSRPRPLKKSPSLATHAAATVTLLSVWTSAAPSAQLPYPQAPSDAAAPRDAGELDKFVPIPGLREFSGRLLVRVGKADPARAHAILAAFDHDVSRPLDIWSIVVPVGDDEDSLAAKLRDKGPGLFEWMRPDWRVFIQGERSVEPSDPQFYLQWHHSAIGTPFAWRTATGLPEVVIAFIDTGVDLTHPDLVSNLVPGYCSYLTVRRSQDDLGVVQDAHGHGTSVAGTAAATGNNALGTSGLGWRLSIMPVRATNPSWPTGSATSMDIINGAIWAADHGARIVNCSFSGISEPYVEDLGAELRARRVLLVWPVDNFAIDYGASFDHPDVLVVAGTTQGDARYQYSSFGLGVDIAAPATAIFAPTVGGGAWYQDGNSFAAPIVAGVAGLVLSAASELTPAQIERVIFESAADLGPPGKDPYYGYGRIDASRAVWLAPLRQFSLGAAPPVEVRARYKVEDLYRLLADPRDITGDGLINAADTAVLRDLLRYDEATETTFRR
jgi:subtilisin family serine protease